MNKCTWCGTSARKEGKPHSSCQAQSSQAITPHIKQVSVKVHIPITHTKNTQHVKVTIIKRVPLYELDWNLASQQSIQRLLNRPVYTR